MAAVAPELSAASAAPPVALSLFFLVFFFFFFFFSSSVAPPAKAGGPLRPSEDLFAKIAQAAEERQANAETPEDEEGASPSPGHAHTLVCVRKHSSARCAWRVFAEKRAAFEHGRKNHYKIGSLAELRKKAAEMDAEEEED